MDSPFPFEGIESEAIVTMATKNFVKEYKVLGPGCGKGSNTIKVYFNLRNAGRAFSMTDWAMSGKHFKPIGKQGYSYFPKGVIMVQRY